MSHLSNVLRTVDTLLDPSRPVVADLRELRDEFELANIAYFGLPSFGSLQTPPRLEVTYEDVWVEHYRARGYANSDPVLSNGLRATSCFDWSHLGRSSDASREFFGEASEFGIGQNGLTIPIMGQGRPIALVSFTSNEKASNWRRFVSTQKSALHIVGVAIHEHIWMNKTPVVGEALSRREQECLSWAAVGKTAFETSIIVGISERTVRHYLETSRKKLDASNITHAVVKAISSNMLSSQVPHDSK